MMDSSSREERDTFLVVSSVVSAALAFLRGYETWIQDELKDLQLRAERVARRAGGNLRQELQAKTQVLRTMEQHDLPEAVRNLRTKIMEINDGTYDDVVDARHYLEEGLYRFDSMVRILLYYRRGLDSLSAGNNDGQAQGDS